MHAHSSKTEQDFEITMTPALYCCTIHRLGNMYLSACGLNINIISYNSSYTAIYIVHVNDRAGVIVNSKACSVLLLCAYILNHVSELLLPSLYISIF